MNELSAISIYVHDIPELEFLLHPVEKNQCFFPVI